MAATPVVYLFHGNDEFAIAQEVDHLKARLGDDATVAMNTTQFDGKTFSFGALHTAAKTIPFLARRRMVILKDILNLLQKKDQRDEFISLLEGTMPEAAIVILESRTLDSRHWLSQWIQGAGELVFTKSFDLPRGAGMVNWIRKQAKESGGEFSLQAADYLASLVHEDTRSVAQEIEKLLSYVDRKRAVDVDDVQLLYAAVDSEDTSMIFHMVDALGNRRGDRAMSLLRQLLQVRDPLSLFGMVVRQIRLLMLAKEVMSLGGDQNSVREALQVPHFVAGKLMSQAQNFSFEVMEQIYRELLAIDERIKVGELEGDLGLEMLIAKLNARS